MICASLCQRICWDESLMDQVSPLTTAPKFLQKITLISTVPSLPTSVAHGHRLRHKPILSDLPSGNDSNRHISYRLYELYCPGSKATHLLCCWSPTQRNRRPNLSSSWIGQTQQRRP